jgi:hypothetical protein
MHIQSQYIVELDKSPNIETDSHIHRTMRLVRLSTIDEPQGWNGKAESLFGALIDPCSRLIFGQQMNGKKNFTSRIAPHKNIQWIGGGEKTKFEIATKLMDNSHGNTQNTTCCENRNANT